MEETQAKILLVDDNKTNLELMKVILEEEGYYIVTASNAAEALRKLKRDVFDLVITDFLMPPGKNGIELTEEIKKKYPTTEVMIITAYGDIENAVKAIKINAYDFIQRPINNEILLLKVKKAVKSKFLSTELEKIKKIFKDELENQYKIVGSSQAMKSLVEKLKIVASTDSTVLVTGESGVGKELFARTVHNLSERRNHHFIPINCGAIPPNLLESELFGYKKGAFTGAYADKTGLFEEANGGTIFLDEIGELPSQVQVKLLRVLQEREIMPIGGTHTKKIDTRIIAATNKDLKAEVAQGEFRKDLYYRLNVITLKIPPLKERKEDIPLLINYFLAKFSEKYKKNIRGFSENAMTHLIQYSWPGNVRELENIVERSVILAHEDWIEIANLPSDVLEQDSEWLDSSVLPYKKAKENFDREYLTHILDHTGGNVKRAAELAQKHRTDLYDMIRKYNIDVDSFRDQGD
jgi:DNA-binding NtrC family response regulator